MRRPQGYYRFRRYGFAGDRELTTRAGAVDILGAIPERGAHE